MQMNGEYRIPASREAVWKALNDPEVLKRAIPGCEEIIRHADDRMEAKVRAKIGPVSATFKGNVRLENLNPPESYTIAGEGSGGAAGGAKGSADVKLTADGSDTLLAYDVKATVTGKLAQLGQRMIDPVAQKLAAQFFENLATELGAKKAEAPVTEAVPAAGPAPTTADARPSGGMPQWAWIAGIVVIVVLLLLLFT